MSHLDHELLFQLLWIFRLYSFAVAAFPWNRSGDPPVFFSSLLDGHCGWRQHAAWLFQASRALC